jgi:hypothetical protein
MFKFWDYWCKALGSKAYDDNNKADVVAIIRTFWAALNIITCLIIIANNSKSLGIW